MRVSKHTHTSAAQSEVGFFLFFFFLLLHPLTAAAGHHPSSSSFATSQTGKHSGRAAGQMGNRPPPQLLLHRQFRVRDVPPVRKDLTRSRPTRFFFPSPLLLLVLFSLLRTFHPNTTKRRKSVARAHTLTHTHAHFFPLCSVVEEKFDFFAVENRPFPFALRRPVSHCALLAGIPRVPLSENRKNFDFDPTNDERCSRWASLLSCCSATFACCC